jgi:hypothetical protein
MAIFVDLSNLSLNWDTLTLFNSSQCFRVALWTGTGPAPGRHYWPVAGFPPLAQSLLLYGAPADTKQHYEVHQ